MSSAKFELDATVRQDLGKGASRRLRHTNRVPAVIYGAGQDPVSLTIDHNKVVTALANEAFYSHILTLKIDQKAEQVILKDVQRDPSKPRVHHMDFLRVRADQKLQMHIPLHFKGDEDAPGIAEGGVVYHAITDVEVSCLPGDLPEFLEVDTSQMHLDDTLHLSHIKLPKGVELVAFSHGTEGHDLPVVSIHKPRIIEDDIVVPVAEEGAAAEGEEGADKAASADGDAAKKEGGKKE
jgi:large subunit ribosomal protein L25